MATVQVTIDNKQYRMACGDGQEAHLEKLASTLDAKVADMRTAFGEIGDMRLTIMAALTVADELSETQARLAQIERTLNVLQTRLDAADHERQQAEKNTADALRTFAGRLTQISANLGGTTSGQDRSCDRRRTGHRPGNRGSIPA
jgi:cell division protein ZapA